MTMRAERLKRVRSTEPTLLSLLPFMIRLCRLHAAHIAIGRTLTPLRISSRRLGHATMGFSLYGLFATACLGWYTVIWAICLLGLSLARKYYLPPVPISPLSHASEGASEQEVPGVTIIRPLAGLDCNLAANLCSTFELQYPDDKLEILMSVKDDHDQALRIAKEVKDRYAHIQSSIIIGEQLGPPLHPRKSLLIFSSTQVMKMRASIRRSITWCGPLRKHVLT